MGITNQILQDSRWRTIIKTDITSTNASPLDILDVSDIDGAGTACLGWVAGSVTNLTSISWSVTSGVEIAWAGTGGVTIVYFAGNGRYGGSDGFPAIPNPTTGGSDQGDVTLSNAAACKGYVVCVFHKVLASDGSGWSG